jgi:branched-chain amino acid transport system ATP-binding protein
MSDALLEVEGLVAGYGKARVLDGLVLRAGRGSVVTVIGPNGAGKSTLLNAIMGVLPARGRIRYDGQEIGDLPLEARVELGMALVPETRALFASMSVEDNLVLGSYRLRARKSPDAMLARVFELFPRLKERRAQRAGTLSGGERQMLAIGRALMGEPKLILLDEPSLGLAPLIVRDIFSIIAGLRQTGVTLLLVEQNARAALEVADYGYVLETGEIVLLGPASELARDPRVAETYLGGRATAQTLSQTL